MGILMFGYKEAEEERKRKEATGKDPTAASRSAIRRQPTVRRRDNPHIERRNDRASPRAVRLSLSNYVVDDRDGEFVIAPRPRLRQSDAAQAWDGRSRRTHRADVEDHLHMRPQERAATRTTERSQRVPPALYREASQASDGAQPSRAASAMRESFLRNEIRYEGDMRARDRATQRALVAGPAARERFGGTAQYWSEGLDEPARGPSPTPLQVERFAPVYLSDREPPPVPLSWPPNPTNRQVEEASRTRTPVLSPNLPPLERQVAREQVAMPMPTTPGHDIGAADGLGDRRRSPSPGEDAWETLITTITHDEHLPSADSSFISATASSSFSSREDDDPASASSTTSFSLADDGGTAHYDRDCDEPGLDMQTPDSLVNLMAADRGVTSSERPNHGRGRIRDTHGSTARDPSATAQSFEEARQELERDIEMYHRSRMQRLLASFLSRGERVPEELWQAFVPRNVLAGAAEVGVGEGEPL